jgi:hypothetical protein
VELSTSKTHRERRAKSTGTIADADMKGTRNGRAARIGLPMGGSLVVTYALVTAGSPRCRTAARRGAATSTRQRAQRRVGGAPVASTCPS